MAPFQWGITRIKALLAGPLYVSYMDRYLDQQCNCQSSFAHPAFWSRFFMLPYLSIQQKELPKAHGMMPINLHASLQYSPDRHRWDDDPG